MVGSGMTKKTEVGAAGAVVCNRLSQMADNGRPGPEYGDQDQPRSECLKIENWHILDRHASHISTLVYFRQILKKP